MSFTVASYNILADEYIKREWYPHTPDSLLDPALRRSALLAHLVKLDVDLLCLQEVEMSTFTAIHNHLNAVGYQGIFARKGQGKPDGCAIFYRYNIYGINGANRLMYADAKLGSETSGHIAQFLSIEYEGNHIGIANTHLKWDPPDKQLSDQYGYRQAAQLLKERDQLLFGCTAWIICGDLNVTPESDVIELFNQNDLYFTHSEEYEAYTANINGRPTVLDYLFHSANLDAMPLPLPTIGPETVLPGSDQPSDHIAVSASFSYRRYNSSSKANKNKSPSQNV
jgi:mRNA deadenylase 3'-5' endonuclease subunit Ccr4